MRIPRNIKTEVEEENSERASDTIKTINNFLFKKIGKPLFWSLPPGTVNIEANIMVTMRAPTTYGTRR